jgi:hypothetical protein
MFLDSVIRVELAVPGVTYALLAELRRYSLNMKTYYIFTCIFHIN